MEFLSDRKQLIIHMDDMGLCYEANEAGKRLFELGTTSSASIMMPCEKAYEFVLWAKEHQSFDVGIHSTVTCEWEKIKWRPLCHDVISSDQASSMTNRYGFMCNSFPVNKTQTYVQDFYNEIKSQIEFALALGLTPSHLDNHMWQIGDPDLFEQYVRLAKEYDLIPFIATFCINDERHAQLIEEYQVKSVTNCWGINGNKDDFYEGLKHLPNGVTVLTIHPVMYSENIRDNLFDYETRVKEFEIFSDRGVLKEIEKNNIELIGWKDLR